MTSAACISLHSDIACPNRGLDNSSGLCALDSLVNASNGL